MMDASCSCLGAIIPKFVGPFVGGEHSLAQNVYVHIVFSSLKMGGVTCSFCQLDFVKEFLSFGRTISAKIS